MYSMPLESQLCTVYSTTVYKYIHIWHSKRMQPNHHPLFISLLKYQHWKLGETVNFILKISKLNEQLNMTFKLKCTNYLFSWQFAVVNGEYSLYTTLSGSDVFGAN